MLSDNEIITVMDHTFLKEQDHKLVSEPLIFPFDVAQLQPASYDVTLGPVFRAFPCNVPWIKTWERGDDLTERFDLEMLPESDRILWVHPGQLVLASTVEQVHIPSYLVGRVEGKSSLGRKGLLVHVTAGFLDPGFHGHITLEMVCVAPVPVGVRAGQRIAQVAFDYLSSPAQRPYGHPDLGSHYQNQGAEPVA